MWWYVYILVTKNWNYYIGSTIDIEKRMKEHNIWQVKSTKYIRPLNLIYTQYYPTIQEARKVEYHIKKQKSKEYVKQCMDF